MNGQQLVLINHLACFSRAVRAICLFEPLHMSKVQQ